MNVRNTSWYITERLIPHNIVAHQQPYDALHEAAEYGDLSQIDLVLNLDPLALNRFHSTQGTTPICWAIQYQQFEAVKKLMSYDANLLAVNLPYMHCFP